MKKRLLIAAVAATMSVAATADISITGGAYVSFASQEIVSIDGANINKDNQHVHLKVVGSAGDTKVVATISGGSATLVDQQEEGHTDVDPDGIHMDSLYLTTKLGPVDIKAGDYWGTIGLGAHSMEAAKKNALSVSTKVGGWKLGLFTENGSDSSGGNGSGSTNVNASGKIGPVTLSAVHNPDDFTDLSAEATLGGVSIAAEMWDDTADTDNDTNLIQIGGEVSGFKWDIARIENDQGAFTTDKSNGYFKINDHDIHATGKFAPLGSMLIGTEARDNTATAVVDVHDFTEILGVAVSTKLAGNTIKAIYTKNTLGDSNKMTGTELIISRPLTNGATLTANIAKISGLDEMLFTMLSGETGTVTNTTNTGLRLDVKF